MVPSRHWLGVLLLALPTACLENPGSQDPVPVQSPAEVRGCFVDDQGGTQDTYLFDGVSRVTHQGYDRLAGSTLDRGDYTVREGSLHITYDSGEQADFKVMRVTGGLLFENTMYEYQGERCP